MTATGRNPSPPDPSAALDPAMMASIAASIEAEYERAPPAIAVIGLSGVGKSSTINAMFGTQRDVSATTRGTSRFHKRTFDIVSQRVYGTSLKCALRIIDAPGLGEDGALDANYLERYRKHLPEADIALWVVAARNRALALDQRYLSELSDVLPSLIVGVNQADLVDPLSWNEAINLPSRDQAANIQTIVEDRAQKLGSALGRPLKAVPYSAHRRYNLQALFTACLDSAPMQRRWMFEVLKGFSTRDWLAQAKGLSHQQRRDIEAKYLKSDQALDLGAFAQLKR